MKIKFASVSSKLEWETMTFSAERIRVKSWDETDTNIILINDESIVWLPVPHEIFDKNGSLLEANHS